MPPVPPSTTRYGPSPRGLAHPLTRALLAAAALTAAAAWEAGHRVAELHPAPGAEPQPGRH
ncbi:hypothetical protein [Streptomyces cirratus]|uniref:hypothetical protein n=1 Tax=Streptomyces cirratus TaxID=68187 RepID=UPI001E33265B|nr:hypothetical protein [Streptomyces cirratus]